MKHIAFIALWGLAIPVALFVLLSCGPRKEYRDALARAEAMMSQHPDSALRVLDSLGMHEADFNRHFRMQYLLFSTLAQTKTGVIFTNDSLTEALLGYFNSNGTKKEKTWAYYLYGCALSDTGHAPEALQAYYDALEVADTLDKDCDHNALKVIYGQMSQIFHKQNLPHDELWAMHHYIDCVRRTSSEEDYLYAKSQMIKPYILLGENDSVLHIIDDTYHSLLRLGKEQRAASALAPSIFVYLERGQLEKALEAMYIFETKSGQFDKQGNIAKGREGYYFIKGFYLLAVKNLESAEFFFRKAIAHGFRSEGFRGLLSVYRKKNDMDSVVYFSQLYEAAQDSLHNQMQTDAVHQASVLYNYSKSQKELEKQRKRADRAKASATYIILLAVLLIIMTIWIYYKKQRIKTARVAKLENDLLTAITTRSNIQEELEKLKGQDYESVIAEKERKLNELTKTIAQLTSENQTYKGKEETRTHNNHLDHFLNSPIALLFVKKASGKTERTVPTESEWKLLTSQFSKDVPVTYKSFAKGKTLSQLEQRICILLILDIPEFAISILSDTSASTISNAKARANEKLFGKKEAHPLKTNLLHALQQS